MAKVNNKTKGFGSIPRDVVYDNELSDRARFVYVYMACKPENWEFYQDKVAAELGYGKDTLRKYLDELIVRGWITENEQQNDGKFGCLEYVIEVKRKVGNLPIRKKADSEKTRNGKIPNQRNIDNISSKQSLSDNKEIEIKRLSNDNQKVDELFIKFWEEYDYKKSKKDAIKAWDKLTDAEKEIAIKAIPLYKQDCKHYQRSMQHPATYLNKRTFEDDFNIIPEYYQNDENDNSTEARYKRYMIKTFPNLIYHRNPLTFEQYMYFVEEYNESGRNYVNESLEKLNTMEVNQFMSIEQGLKRLLKESEEDRVYGDE